MQIGLITESVADGNEFTVTVTKSVKVFVHGFAPDEITFTKVKVAFVVKAAVVNEFVPAKSNRIDCGFPKLSR